MTGGCICAICYEDVDPVSELLQSIALCGHVFHELCLQQWIEFCPNGRAPTCPLCKQHCGVKDVHRLYFQSDSSLTKTDVTHEPCQKTPSDREVSQNVQVNLCRLEAKVAMLTAECEASREKLLRAESESHKHLEQVKELEAEKLIWRKDKGLLAQSVARTQEELRKTAQQREELLERTEAMAKDVAAYRLATDVNLTEVDMSRLISPASRSASKDDIIDMMTKALFLQNRAFKDLMHKCQELGMEESRAEQKSQKLMEQVKRMKTRMQEMAKAEEEKENAKVRYLARTKLSAETTMKPELSPIDTSSAHVANVFGKSPLLCRPHPKAKKAGDTTEAASLPLAPVPPNVICLDSDSEAQRTKVKWQGCVAGFSEIVPASQRYDEGLALGKRNQNSLSQPDCARTCGLEPYSRGLGDQSQELFGLRTTLGQSIDEREPCQEVRPSRSEVIPKLTIGLDGDIDDVDALRRRPMLPIRQELGLGQGATSFTRPQSATGFQMPSATDQAGAPSESKFILSGADGRGGRVRVLKPPRLIPGGRSSSGSGVMGKRFKPNSHIAGARSSSLKIEHFFGRG